MKRKLMSLLLSAVLLTGSTSYSVIAIASTDETKSLPIMSEDVVQKEPLMMTSNEPTEEALEAAIKAVKRKIEIPKEYSEFNYSYYGTNSYSGVYWNLNWRTLDNSYIDVSLDQNNNITRYSAYDYSNGNRNIPSYLKEELEDEAEAFIKKIAPDIYPKIDFVSSSYDSIYSNNYTYNFQRKEKGIIFPDNSVSIRVNAATGDITSASIEWLREAKVPSGVVKLTKEDAAKLIGENLNMKLTYKTNYYRIFDSNQNEKYVKKAFLVYEPELSYVSIDANTGEVYLNRSEWVEMDFLRQEKSKEDYDTGNSLAGGVSGALTEEEIAKIRELDDLISKDKAIEIVTTNKYLHIDDNLLSYTANLNQTYTRNAKDSSYVWNIRLRDNRPVDYNKNEDRYRAYANATIDAKTGKILSFNSSIKNSYDYESDKWLPVEIKYDRSYGQSILEKFLNSQVKSQFKKTKLVDQREDYVLYYKEDDIPVYGGYSYRYNRFNEGIEFIYNGISGSVDGVTGKIYYYNTNWDDDVIFDSPKNAMTSEKAFEHYIGKDGFNLLYEINVINQYDPNYKSEEKYYDYSEAYRVAYEVRLVYRPDINPSYISPFTGEQLNNQGEAYVTSKPYQYKDIADTKENREILLLADMGIGFEEDNFNPEKLITEGEINQLLEKLGYWNSDSEKVNASTKLLTREELAYDFIKRLGLEKIAKISGIYTTGYSDQDKINPNYLGAVALAKGLEIFSEQSSNLFNPKSNISRRDAIQLLFDFIKAEAVNYY